MTQSYRADDFLLQTGLACWVKNQDTVDHHTFYFKQQLWNRNKFYCTMQWGLYTIINLLIDFGVNELSTEIRKKLLV